MDPARARSFACGVEAAAFLNEHSLSGAEALDYVLEIAAERQCDPVLALIWVDRHLADPSASRELRTAARRHPMFGSRKSSVVVAGDFAYKVISHSPLRVRLWTTHGGPEEASGPLAAQIAQEVAVAGSNRRELRQTLEGAWYVLSRRTKRQRQETGGGQRNITTRQRRLMPQSDFGLPIKSQSPGFRATHPKFAGAYPMQDRSHAANARGRAVQMLNSGHLSLREARIIFARTSSKWGFADKDLVRIDGRWKSVPAARRRRAAANH